MPYVISCDFYILKEVSAQTMVTLDVYYSQEKVIGSKLMVDIAWYENSDWNWYRKRREAVLRSKIYQEAVSINLLDIDDKISKCQSDSYLMPELKSEIELPIFNNSRIHHTSPKSIDLYLEREGKIFVETLEVKPSQLKSVLVGFKNRNGTSGVVYISPDKNLKFDKNILKSASGLGLYTYAMGYYKKVESRGFCQMYNFEGPPPPEEFIENEIVSEDQTWIVDQQFYRFKGEKYTKDQAQKIISEAYDKASIGVKIQVVEGTTWQQVMSFYEILPEDIFRSIE